jgi:hypothetical protein
LNNLLNKNEDSNNDVAETAAKMQKLESDLVIAKISFSEEARKLKEQTNKLTDMNKKR